jgi:hypothetical protein
MYLKKVSFINKEDSPNSTSRRMTLAGPIKEAPICTYLKIWNYRNLFFLFFWFTPEFVR